MKVCVPYRPDTPERVANWNRTQPQWKHWDLYWSDSDGETFGRSQACNRAAFYAGDWQALVFADCDLLLEDVLQAAEAIDLALEIKGYVACYDIFYYLAEEETARVRAGHRPQPHMAYYHLTEIWGGTFAIHREAWEAVGGFDESIKSWGGEDGRFLRQLEDQGTPRTRVAGAVYHLKHPLAPGAR